VDCAEIRQGFLTGVVPSGPSVGEHLKWCPHCRELFRDDATLGRHLAGAAALSPQASTLGYARVSNELAAERGARAFLRSRSTRTRWLLSLVLPAVLIARELFRNRVPLGSMSVPRLIVGGALLGVLLLVTWVALLPAPAARPVARLRSALAFFAWCLPCALLLVPETRSSGDDSHFALRSFTCFGYGSALAAPSFALGWVFDRGLELPYRVWAFGAGVVALLANSILLVHCPIAERAHLIVGHFSIGLTWFLAVSLGEWWRRRV